MQAPSWITRAAEPGMAGRLKLGLLLPPEEPQATSVREGVLLAQEQAGQAHTGQVQVVIHGRVGQWGADAVEAARMVTDEGAQGLITPPDGAASHLVLQVSGRTAVPVVSLCADSSVSRTGVPWMLRVVPCTVEEAALLFTKVPAATRAHTNRWLALVPAGRAGREIKRDLKIAARTTRCRLDAIAEVAAGLTNANWVREQVLGSHANAVLLWLPPVLGGKIASLLKTDGFTGVMAGPAWLQCVEFMNAAGDALEGFLIPGIVQSSEGAARLQSFQAAYQKRWGHQPNWMAEMSYDAAEVLIQVLRQAEFQAPPHRLRPDFSWLGVTGDLKFDSEGNRQVRLQLLRGGRTGFHPGESSF